MKSLFLLTIVFTSVNAFSQSVAVAFPIGGTIEAICITPTNDDGYIMLQYDNSISASSPILVKTDVNFEIEWSKKLDMTYSFTNENSNIQQLSDGNYLLFYLGGNMAKFSATGDLMWNTSAGIGISPGGYTHNRKCVEKPDGKLVFMSTDYEDFKIFQFSSSGIFEWAQKFHSTDPAGYGKCPGFDMIGLEDGSIFVSGKRGNDNCFVRIDDLGNVIWSNVIDFDDTYSRAWAVAKTEDDNIIVVGLRTSMGFIMKMSPLDGSVIWQKEVNNMYFEDIMPIGNNQFALLGKGVYEGDDLGITVFDGNCDLVSSAKFDGLVSSFTYPKLLQANGKFFFSALNYPWGLGKLTLLEFDSTLSFECKSLPLTITKIAFTLPVIDLGTLETSVEPDGCSYALFAVTDVSTSIANYPFCEVTVPVMTDNALPDPTYGESIMLTFADNTNEGKINIFPNPVSQNSTITISLSVDDEYLMKLTDVSGKTVVSNVFTGNSISVSSNDLARGLYMLNIVSITSHKAFVQKLMVK